MNASGDEYLIFDVFMFLILRILMKIDFFKQSKFWMSRETIFSLINTMKEINPESYKDFMDDMQLIIKNSDEDFLFDLSVQGEKLSSVEPKTKTSNISLSYLMQLIKNQQKKIKE
jgi:hypothetical protein